MEQEVLYFMSVQIKDALTERAMNVAREGE